MEVLKQNPPLISIAMAVFNGSKYINLQIDSILTQTYSNIELVILDDCSVDNTIELIEPYLYDSRVKLFKNDRNMGYKKNFEKAISLCSGEFIALSDQDDIWFNNKLDYLINNIGEYDLIHSDAHLIDSENMHIHSSYSKYSSKSLNSTPKNIILNGFVTGCTCMFNSRICKDILPFPDGDYVHDRWISLISSINKGITYANLPLISYRQHSDNISGASSFSWDVRSMTNSIIGFNRQNGILQHFLFASLIKDFFPKTHYIYDDLIRAHKFYIALKNGSLKGFIVHSFYFRNTLNNGDSLYLRFLKYMNLIKIVIKNKFTINYD
tara:strand:+ start:811 stop:1782 length:972 start_codon:yes stop_codon:yes gene_type:complete